MGAHWKSAARWSTRAIVALVAGALLYWAFRHVRLGEIGQTLGRFSIWQALVIVALSVGFHMLVGLRWWGVARVDLPRLPLMELIIVRLAAFGLSYFTPGPQVGGEPVQVLYLRRRRGATLARATATVIMDKLIELLAGFLFLVVGVAVLLQQGVLRGIVSLSPAFVLGIGLLIAWPPVHISLLWRGRHPVSGLLGLIHPPTVLRKAFRLTRAAEHLAGRFCRQRPGALIAGIGVSLLAGFVAVMEYGLITSYLGLQLTLAEMIAGWTAGWISFLFPLPGGLGALEASQVIALGAFGVSDAAALGVALVLRFRDLVFGGTGLVLAARQVGEVVGRMDPAGGA